VTSLNFSYNFFNIIIMLATIGAIGRALLPQLVTIGGRMLGSSGLGRTIKKAMDSPVGALIKSGVNEMM
jgi:hypothetical protein